MSFSTSQRLSCRGSTWSSGEPESHQQQQAKRIPHPTTLRALQVYFTLTVLTWSYITAFMESLTISGFPCYSFKDRHTVGGCESGWVDG